MLFESFIENRMVNGFVKEIVLEVRYFLLLLKESFINCCMFCMSIVFVLGLGFIFVLGLRLIIVRFNM